MPTLCNIDREIRLARLASALRAIVKLDDVHMRRVAYARAGLGPVSCRDDLDAAAIAAARRRALASRTEGVAA